MAMRLVLPTSSGALLLGKSEWCRVVLRVGFGERLLGSDLREKVVQKMRRLAELEHLATVNGNIHGYDVACVVSLMDPHSAFFAADTMVGRQVFVENRHGEMSAEFVLTDAHRKEWIRLLGEVG